MKFDELGLSEKVLKAVEASGYLTPTPIQEQAIPYVLEGRDVLGIAQTGTGKTAAFTLPMLSLLEKGRARARMPRTLILEPTRELAAQVEEAFGGYGVNHKLNLALLIGGVSFGDQETRITRGADVLIATPGRLLDFAERGKLLLTGIEILVIDEADRMLDMGFIPDIERICKLVPANRQTLFFSATMPPEITRLSGEFLRDPVRIEVTRPATAATTIAQTLVRSGASPEDKRATLRRIIRGAENFKNALIFCNRKRDVQVVHRSLEKHGFSVDALHGDLDQRSRMAALDGFRNGQVQLLVCSDVAARGLDIPDVSHVINYDAPHHSEDYVHRIGRTGRAGKLGIALTIVTRADARSLEEIEKLIGGKIDYAPGHPQPEELETEQELAREAGRGRTHRSSPRAEGRRRSQPSETPRPARSGERHGRGERHHDAERAEPAPRGARDEAAPHVAHPEAPADAPRPARSSERHRRGERHSDTERAASAPRTEGHPKLPAETPRPVRSSERQGRGERHSETERAESAPRTQRRPRHEAPEAPVIGLGDHVPSFLLRPSRPARPAPAEAETED